MYKMIVLRKKEAMTYKDILLCDKSKTSKFINLITSSGITSILLFCIVSFFRCLTSSKRCGSISYKKNCFSKTAFI